MTQPTNFRYFIVTFSAISAGIIAGLITKGLFDVDLNDLNAICHLILKSIIIGIIVGAVLGLLNIYFKFEPFRKTRTKDL
ncbi:hypothetical protein [Daejeonella sp.]|uniref:hypothetical protein n=1 Tax=Daejeonella sp. TaxID=2805397 RepID=UPI0030C49721